jgi:hypothetical protein
VCVSFGQAEDKVEHILNLIYDPKNGASCIVHIGFVNELCDTIFIL